MGKVCARNFTRSRPGAITRILSLAQESEGETNRRTFKSFLAELEKLEAMRATFYLLLLIASTAF